MCGSMVDIKLPAAENRRGKKKERKLEAVLCGMPQYSIPLEQLGYVCDCVSGRGQR